MVFIRFRRLELRDAGGWLGSATTRGHLNGILQSRSRARGKLTIFCTEVTGLMVCFPPLEVRLACYSPAPCSIVSVGGGSCDLKGFFGRSAHSLLPTC